MHRDVKSLYDLCSNKESSNENIVIYREPGDGKNIIRIRSGTSSYIKKQIRDDDIVSRYDNISNSKMFIREAKKMGYIPKNGNSIVYDIPLAADRKKLRHFLRAINDKHIQDQD